MNFQSLTIVYALSSSCVTPVKMVESVVEVASLIGRGDIADAVDLEVLDSIGHVEALDVVPGLEFDSCQLKFRENALQGTFPRYRLSVHHYTF